LSALEVGGHDPGGIGGANGEVGAGKLVADDGANNGRFGGSQASVPTRLAGIRDQ
jgi:hypothetical protein